MIEVNVRRSFGFKEWKVPSMSFEIKEEWVPSITVTYLVLSAILTMVVPIIVICTDVPSLVISLFVFSPLLIVHRCMKSLCWAATIRMSEDKVGRLLIFIGLGLMTDPFFYLLVNKVVSEFNS